MRRGSRISFSLDDASASPVSVAADSTAARPMAMSTFDPGPAAPTSAQSRLGFLRRETTTGTGFAPPKMKPERERMRAAAGS
jgi:hypothetical protein